MIDLDGARTESIVDAGSLEGSFLGPPEPGPQEAVFVWEQRELVGREPHIERTAGLRRIDDINADVGRAADRRGDHAADVRHRHG